MVMEFAAWESGVLGYEGLPAYSGGGSDPSDGSARPISSSRRGRIVLESSITNLRKHSGDLLRPVVIIAQSREPSEPDSTCRTCCILIRAAAPPLFADVLLWHGFDRRLQRFLLCRIGSLHRSSRGCEMENMEEKAADMIFTIVRMLSKAADSARLKPLDADALNRNVEALMLFDTDEFVRTFLAIVKDARGVLSRAVSNKLKAAGYP